MTNAKYPKSFASSIFRDIVSIHFCCCYGCRLFLLTAHRAIYTHCTGARICGRVSVLKGWGRGELAVCTLFVIFEWIQMCFTERSEQRDISASEQMIEDTDSHLRFLINHSGRLKWKIKNKNVNKEHTHTQAIKYRTNRANTTAVQTHIHTPDDTSIVCIPYWTESDLLGHGHCLKSDSIFFCVIFAVVIFTDWLALLLCRILLNFA